MPVEITEIQGNIIDIFDRRIYTGSVKFYNGKIISVEKSDKKVPDQYILPGFIDSHVHIESSMIIPSEFARLAVVHGTVATVSDPHEIANVCGTEGVKYMIDNGKKVPFKFNFGAPSCVPATEFETAGAVLSAKDVSDLLAKDDIKYLSEMMNFPGVLYNDTAVMEKIAAARAAGKPVDGHAPGLKGKQAKQYIDAGISTDHECFTKEEALGKLQYGMKVIIREGSAAKNFEALIELLHTYPAGIMFCSDDKHPDSLVEGHINRLCARAVTKKIDLFHVLQAACINPVLHYKLGVGLLRTGDDADFIVVKDLESFDVLQTYIGGKLVAENGRTRINSVSEPAINNFNCLPVNAAMLAKPYAQEKNIPVIEALDGQLITNKLEFPPPVKDNCIVSDTHKDILKMVVINRYRDAPVAIAFVKNFNLKKGAIASSVAHDSHNIIAVGTDDESLAKAINLVIEKKGGISCADKEQSMVIGLPVAGLMSNEDGYRVAGKYTAIDKMAKAFGSNLSAPFMTLSFMALLVIPHLKLSDKGLFDGDNFKLQSF